MKPFVLAEGPLIRARIVRMGLHDHLLVFVEHHIVFDGWSIGVFLTEFKDVVIGSPIANRVHKQIEHFIIGTPSAGRTRMEFENLVGYFINMLPIRTRLAGDAPFADVVRQVHRAGRDAFRHQDYPFPEMVKELGAGGDKGRTPIFQTPSPFKTWSKASGALLPTRGDEASLRLESLKSGRPKRPTRWPRSWKRTV